MVRLSAEARSLIESRHAAAPAECWFLAVSWVKGGGGDNSRAADGTAVWTREADKGWRVRLHSWPKWPEEVPMPGEPLLPGVRLHVMASADHVFPGGEVVVRDGRLGLTVDPA